jgi:hypothetical protein
MSLNGDDMSQTRAPHAGADAHLIFTSIMGHYFITRNTSNDEIASFSPVLAILCFLIVAILPSYLHSKFNLDI